MRKSRHILQRLTGSIALCVIWAISVHATTPEVVDSTRTYHIGEVIVTGSNNATGRNLLPYTVSTIGSPQLEATGQSQLLSAISVQVPSLFVSERNIFGFGVSSGGSGGIKIRGVGGSPTNSVLMMVDGQPQFAGIYSHHVADFYETEYVDRVEVLRGPGSVLYGSNAMGVSSTSSPRMPKRTGCIPRSLRNMVPTTRGGLHLQIPPVLESLLHWCRSVMTARMAWWTISTSSREACMGNWATTSAIHGKPVQTTR